MKNYSNQYKKTKCGYKCVNFGWSQKRWQSMFLKQEGVGERGNTSSSPLLASVKREREKKPFPCACPLFLFCQGTLVQVVFGAMLWLFLALSLCESQLLAAVNPSNCSQCRELCKPQQSGILRHLAALYV